MYRPHDVKERVSVWKFEPSPNGARDNELTAIGDSDWGEGFA